MAGSTGSFVKWDAEDGAGHNFSPASLRYSPELYLACVPGAKLPGWSAGEVDLGLRFMALTSWLDLMVKVNIKQVLCVMPSQEMDTRYKDLAERNFGRACESQGLKFAHIDLVEERWPSVEVASEIFKAMKMIRDTLPSGGGQKPRDSWVLATSDASDLSAVMAVCWICFLSPSLDPLSAAKAVSEEASNVGLKRDPLKAFGSEDDFTSFISEVLKSST
mmetsp:Transcript_11927/g.25915  ORF Transcript_11927/g.25915 Transcript_11927/m.25915 type:complete len:219 (+) Transcript_11927:106-762(+)